MSFRNSASGNFHKAMRREAARRRNIGSCKSALLGLTPPSSSTAFTLTHSSPSYIHGGAWRDPRIDHTSALPSITSILKQCATGGSLDQRRIAGFASINYRLSPHPSFPQDPETEDPSRLRAARHPDHLRDVCAALALLGREVIGSTPYVLFGHSCGATLALQLLMRRELLPSAAEDAVPLPAAVVGFQGMYNLLGLNARFGGAYKELLKGAFGPDQALWEAASPGRFGGSFRANWGAGVEKKVAVVAYSPQDELIDKEEIDTMEKVLRDDGLNVLAYRDLEGGHDEVREDGRHIARVLLETIKDLDRLEKK